MTLAVVVSQFPELHETFIVRELQALIGAGIPVRIYSLKPCRDRIVHPDALALVARTEYLALGDARLWGQAAAAALRHPMRALAALGTALRYHAWPPLEMLKAVGVWVQSLALTRRLPADGIAHLHAHWATMPTTAAALLSRWLGVPFSFTAHAWDVFVRNPSLAKKARLAERVITCTDYNRRHLTALCPEAAGKIVLNYHGVSVEQFQRTGTQDAGRRTQDVPAPASSFQLPVSRDVPLLLSVGRLVDTKGFDTLIDSYRLLRDRGASFQAIIVGEGPQRRRLARAIRSLGLAEFVELQPALPREALRQLYAQASAFVLPCRVARNGDRDGIPNVILEAMAMGLPVVSTRISGIPEAVQDQETGVLVEPDDPRGLSEALERWLANPAALAQAGRRGRERAAAAFDERTHMSQLVTQMQELLKTGTQDAGRRTQPFQLPASSFQHPSSIRVLYVIWSLEVGGAEQVVALLASHLDRAAFTPLVSCLNHAGALGERLRAERIPVFPLHKRGAADARVLWRLIRLIRRERIDLVHTHLWGANLWGRLAARLAGVPVVATEHNTDVWKRPWHFRVDRALAPLTARVVAVSEAVRAFYLKRGLPADRLLTIPNGIETGRFPVPARSTLYETLGWPGATPVFAAIGRLVETKRHDAFIDAMAVVHRKRPQARALIVGEGPMRAALERRIRAHRLEGIVVLAGLRDDIPALLAGARAVVFTSEREGMPMVILEAMASGVSVVAVPVGGIPEIIEDGRTGWLIGSREPQPLAERLIRLCDDPALARSTGAAAQAAVRARWSVEAMARAHEALYRQVMGATDPRSTTRAPARVTYVIDHLDIGGAQQQLFELARHLPRERFAPRVISLSAARSGLAERFRQAGVDVVCLEPPARWSWRTLSALIRLLRVPRPSVVHTWLFTAGLYGRLAARLAGVPAVVSSIRSIDTWKPKHHSWTDRALQHLTDVITVNAEVIKPVLIRRERIRPEKLTTIYNGVDLEAFSPSAVNGQVRRDLGLSAEPVVGLIGRLKPEKDPLTFVRAAARVAEEIPSARFLMVGDGPLREVVRQEAERLGLGERLILPGFRADRAALLQAMDVVALSSIYEGCANVILEAMAMAKPVVATTVGGNPELIEHGRTGLLVPSQNAAAMADAIVELLRDAAARRRMGGAGRARVEREFTMARMVERTAALYDRCLERRMTHEGRR